MKSGDRVLVFHRGRAYHGTFQYQSSSDPNYSYIELDELYYRYLLPGAYVTLRLRWDVSEVEKL